MKRAELITDRDLTSPASSSAFEALLAWLRTQKRGRRLGQHGLAVWADETCPCKRGHMAGGWRRGEDFAAVVVCNDRRRLCGIFVGPEAKAIGAVNGVAFRGRGPTVADLLRELKKARASQPGIGDGRQKGR
jgi:hypothetical protein